MKKFIAASLAAALASACAPSSPSDGSGPAALSGDALENRIWDEQSGDPGRPGAFIAFLSNGTMVTDSCWETHRIEEWRRDGDHALTWREDSEEINANIVSLTPSELVLELKLRGGPERKTYVPAQAPFLCPDMPR